MNLTDFNKATDLKSEIDKLVEYRRDVINNFERLNTSKLYITATISDNVEMPINKDIAHKAFKMEIEKIDLELNELWKDFDNI